MEHTKENERFAVVPMAEKHLNALAEIEQLCFSQPWSKEGLASELLEPTACFRVVQLGDDTVAGYAGMHCVLDEAYVANVAVHPEFRRQGVAVVLMKELECCAVERGASFLSLEVRASNVGAIALYQSCGFETIGVRRGMYEHPKEDGIVMTKRWKEEGSL